VSHQSQLYPNEANAAQLVQKLLHREPLRVSRFRTGLAHYVYEVQTAEQPLVVRMAAGGPESLNSAVYWAERLIPLKIPLPAILGDDRQAQLTPYPALVLERLPGTDLGHVYHTLSLPETRALAAEIVQIQRLVGTLPPGPAYGFATSYTDQGLLPNWEAVVEQSLVRSHTRIRQLGRVDVSYVERVQALMPRFSSYFKQIAPRPFLDDTTTKNVLVDQGRLSGIVDVDYVCFGDPLFTVALTQMALLSMGADTTYTDVWCELLDLTDEQRAAFQFYTCLFCVDFLSEIGHDANQNNAETQEEKRIAQLLAIFESLMKTGETRHDNQL
jgi:aminoglycoside phosphotransferase (APT) family kinase protein